MNDAVTIGRTHKITLLIALYMAQGLPYGFFTQALPVLLRESGYSLTAISVTQLLYLPWALKFLWAPYMDHLGTRKRWLLLWQLSSVVAALLLTQLDLDHGFTIVVIAAFAFNIIAASQDVITDGLAVRILDPKERGLGNGIQVGAYRLGMIFGGGLLLAVFAKTNWATMFACMAGLLALTVLPVFSMRDAPRTAAVSPQFRQLLIGWAQRILQPGMIGFAALIFCYRFGDAMISNVLGPFLKDSGLSIEAIALMKGTVGSATSLGGSFIGGWFAFRVSRRTLMLTTGLAQAVTFVLYIVAAFGIGGVSLLWTATILEGVIGTTATVALFTLMMDASDPEHAGTDYTLFASFFVLVNLVGTFCSSAIVDAYGYAPAFIIATVLAAAGCLALVWTLDRKAMPERVGKVWNRSDR